ncbi:MAG: LacI family transcriptional regulator [bacterium]|nr:LacI family transcriptional regulator [bacterium]
MKTMREISEELGVSIATVSYVYNDRWKEKKISRELAERIKRKLEEEEYNPNILSLQFMTQKTQSIGIILGDLSRIFNLNILCGIEKVLSKEDYVSIVVSSELGKKEKQYLKIMESRRVDGIIFAPHNNREIQFIKRFCKNTSLVFVDNYLPEINTSFVVSDNWYGVYEAVKYLIKKGRKKIAYAGSNKELIVLKERFKGYKDALRDADLNIDNKLIWKVSDSSEYPAILNEMFSKINPDAIFVESLLYFKKGFRFFYEKGIKIPDDVLIAGFDPVDLSLSEMSEVGLHLVVRGTIPFVEQRGEEMGKKAAEILLGMLNGKKEIQQIFIKPELKNFK